MKKSFIRLAFALSLAVIFSQAAYGTGNDNPTGVTGQYNGSITTAGAVDPYTGNGSRTVQDISITGAVGAYPLQWSRTLNTRNITGPRALGRGGWTHSYDWHIYLRTSTNPPHWNDETEDYYEGPDAVVYYPDGRQVWFEGAPGYDYVGAPEMDTSVLLKHVGGGNYDLYLPDGGMVQFELGPYLDGTVTRTGLLAKTIIDPYGVVTTLHRDSAGRLSRVQEAAGRYLQINYTNQLITSVQAFANEGNLVETVSYVYGYLGFYLTQVNYDDFTHAFYTYQPSNNSGTDAALIRTCDDIRYAGPMGKIEYVFMPVGLGIDFGQLKGEKYPGMAALVSQVTYPAYNCCAWDDPAGFVRTETRADGATRRFQYGIGGGELTGFSDFKNQWSSTARVVEPGNHFARRINTDARSNSTTIEKTFHGKTNRLFHPDGSYQAFVYDYSVNGYPYYLLIHGDENGRNTFYERDANHRVKKIWYGFNPNNHNAYPTEEFTYNPLGQILTHKLTSGGTEVFEYDNGLNNRGLKTKHTDPLGKVTRFYYYESGPNTDRLRVVVDPRGNSTAYEYNQRGQVTKVQHQDWSYSQSGYNADGTLAWTADENHPGAVNDPNQRTRYIYDEYKRVVSVTNPMNETTTNIYAPWNGAGSLSHTTSTVYQVHSPMGKQVHHDYDANFRRTITRAGVTADDAWTFYEYDEVGNLKKTTDPRWNETAFGYDNRNRKIWMDNAIASNRNSTGHTFNWGYDAVGNKIRETRTDDAFRTWEYEPVIPMNRLVKAVDWRMSVSEPAQNTTYARNATATVETITDPKNAVYTFTFDALHRKTSETYPADRYDVQRNETWHYDAVGNMDEYKNRAGARKVFAPYDNRNRPTSFSWHDEPPGQTTQGQSFGYDDVGNVTSLQNAQANLSFTFDAANRKKSETATIKSYGLNQTHTVSYEYDADGNRSRYVYPLGLDYRLTYTQRNQLAKVQLAWAGTPTVDYIYDPAGNRTRRNTYYGAYTDYHFTPLNQLDWQASYFANGVARFDYGFDAAHRIKYEQRDSGAADGFGYDARNQLTAYQRDGSLNANGTVSAAYNLTINYDANGNRINADEGCCNAVYTTAPNNEYASDWTGALPYDNNANLTGRAGWIYGYDAQNRLISIDGGNVHIRQHYDPLNRIVARDTNGDITTQIWDNWNLIEERTWNNELRRLYFWGANTNEIVASYGPAYGDLFYFQDGRGNVTHLADPSNTVVERYTYFVSGQPNTTYSSGPSRDNQFLFGGARFIREAEIYDMRNRFYHPNLGRFMQSDPIGFDAGDMNLFRYCGNDPVNRTDPMGLFAGIVSRGSALYENWIGADGLSIDAHLQRDLADRLGNQPDQKVHWEITGNFRDPVIKNHLTDKKLTAYGQPSAAQTITQLTLSDGRVDLKIDWFIRRSVPEEARAAVARAEVRDHVRDWLKWAQKMKSETAMGQQGTTQRDLKHYLNDYSKKRGGIPLNSKFFNEHLRQIKAYDFPYFPLSIPGPHAYSNFSDKPLGD